VTTMAQAHQHSLHCYVHTTRDGICDLAAIIGISPSHKKCVGITQKGLSCSWSLYDFYKEKADRFPGVSRDNVRVRLQTALSHLQPRDDLSEADTFATLAYAAFNMTCGYHQEQADEIAEGWLVTIQGRGCQHQYTELDESQNSHGSSRGMSPSQTSYPYQYTTTTTSAVVTSALTQPNLFSTPPPHTEQSTFAPSVSPRSVERYTNPATLVSEVSNSSLDYDTSPCPPRVKLEPGLPINSTSVAFTTTRVEETTVR
jgi:hypothetical protein